MNGFIMHVGHRNVIDIDFTMKRRRTFEEMVSGLPEGAEREYFANDKELHAAFPQGSFNCWGVPPKAKPSFVETAVGDAVFFAPTTGIHGGCIQYIGVIKAICELDCWAASRLLWPQTPHERLFPLLFFFDTEAGEIPWYDFLDDLGIKHGWNPRGWYKRIPSTRFQQFGGVNGYVNQLRKDWEFKLVPQSSAAASVSVH